MNFKELFTKYKNNETTEEETRIIENEIEKNELINDFLADQVDLKLGDITYNNDDTINQTNLIKKAVNKKLAKIVAISIISVFVILAIIKYIVSPLMSSAYYNPTEKTVGNQYRNNLYFDLRTFTELNIPGYVLTRAAVDPLGFGSYSLYVKYRDTFDNNYTISNTKLAKNKYYHDYENLLHRNNLVINDISHNEEDFHPFFYSETINTLKKIPDSSYVSTFVALNKDITLKEFFDLQQTYRDKIDFKWIGIRVTNNDNAMNHPIGFNPNLNDGPDAADHPNKEKYRYLALIDYMDDLKSMHTEESYQNLTINAYKIHFTSLLKYMNDREVFVRIFDFNRNKTELYKNALTYVEEKGINSYGFLVYGEAKEMLDFIEHEDVKEARIDNVKVSKYSK